MRDGSESKVLMRSRDGRMLAGVCAGIADYFGLDVTLVRLIWAVVISHHRWRGCPGLSGGVDHHSR